ncbi:MAG: 6-bladed beta-propeller [Nitrospiria bacterium]
MNRLIALSIILFLMGGCAGNVRHKEPELFWPPPPETPRIKFIKTISSSAEVEKRSLTDRIKALLFGRASGASLVKPYAVFATPDERIYVADSGWRKVLVFDSKQKRFSMIGVDGPGALAGPLGVAVDENGRVYVTDMVLRKCLVFDSEGTFLFEMGDLNRLERPVGVAVNNTLKRVYIADTRKHKIFVFDMEGNFLFEIGKRGNKDGELNFPANLFVDASGNLYVTDMNFRVQIFDPDGKFLSKFGSIGTGFGQFSLPKGIGVDSQGHVYVVDSRFNNVQIFDQDGTLLLFFGEFGGAKGQFWLPAGLTVDHQDRIYVADQYNHRIDVFQYIGPKKGEAALAPGENVREGKVREE